MLLKGIFFATGEADNNVTSKQLGNTTTDISVCFAWISCAPAGSKSGVHAQLPTLSHLPLTYIFLISCWLWVISTMFACWFSSRKY